MTTERTTVRALLVGTGTPAHRQDHQQTMYLPAIRSLADQGFAAIGVWDPFAGSTSDSTGDTGTAGHDSRAATLAAAADVDLLADAAAALATEPQLAVVCADPADVDGLAAVLQQLADAGVPTLLDKPTLLTTEQLTGLAERFGAVTAGHPWRFHPAMTGAQARVRSGGLGLLHAVHGELLVGPTDGPHPQGELRNLAVHALDIVQSLIGDLHGRAHAVIAPAEPAGDGAGEAITLSLRCEPDVAVTLLIGRSGGAGDRDAAAPAGLVHRYRVLGSHGQMLLDLDSPGLDIVGHAARRVPFGPNAIARQLQAVAAGGGQPGLAVAAGLGAVLDALADGAETHRAVSF